MFRGQELGAAAAGLAALTTIAYALRGRSKAEREIDSASGADDGDDSLAGPVGAQPHPRFPNTRSSAWPWRRGQGLFRTLRDALGGQRRAGTLVTAAPELLHTEEVG